MEIPWECPECGSQANLTDAICPNCGHDRTARPKTARKAKEESADA